MNIFKKTAACLAAAAVMTSLAVTASAEYQISGISLENEYCIRVKGLPESAFNDPNNPVITVTLMFENGDESYDKAINTTILRKDDNKATCHIISKGSDKTADLVCKFVSFSDGEIGIIIHFPVDSEYLAEFMKYGTGCVAFMGGYQGDDGKMKMNGYTSDGELVELGYVDRSAIAWEALNPDENSEPSPSEPASSETSGFVEPAPSESASSEPASEPVSSEPVSEPAASEPVSSEPAPVQPDNVDTGVTGIAAVVGAAALAAGAVTVTRKKK